MIMIALGAIGTGIILKWMGWLNFTKGGNSPLHIQFTIFGYGVTIARPETPEP